MTTKISLDNIQPTALTEIAGGGVTAYSTIASLPLSNNTTGYIEDLRITKGLARYTANFTPPTTELLG